VKTGNMVVMNQNDKPIVKEDEDHRTKPTASSSTTAGLSVFVRISPLLALEQEEPYLEEMTSAAIAIL
jgi:hypothetical protein